MNINPLQKWLLPRHDQRKHFYIGYLDKLTFLKITIYGNTFVCIQPVKTTNVHMRTNRDWKQSSIFYATVLRLSYQPSTKSSICQEPLMISHEINCNYKLLLIMRVYYRLNKILFPISVSSMFYHKRNQDQRNILRGKLH